MEALDRGRRLHRLPGNHHPAGKSARTVTENSRPNQYRKLKIVNRTHDNWYGTDPSATPCTTRGWTTACAPSTLQRRTPSAADGTATLAVRATDMDMSAFKDFDIVREQTVGFRFDAFNAFNIVSYGNPDTGITDSNFGNVSNQNVSRRNAICNSRQDVPILG